MKIQFAIILTAASLVFAQESCIKNGKHGTCKAYGDCKPAMNDFKKYKTRPQLCSDGTTVCCVERNKYGGHATDQVHHMKQSADSCEPIASNLTAAKTGQKAWDKCLEYQEKLVYPCRESNTPSGGMIRLDFCNRKPDSLIIGGVDAYEGEFPHMVFTIYSVQSGTACRWKHSSALDVSWHSCEFRRCSEDDQFHKTLSFLESRALLGFANGTQDQHWACGGVLISERFIVTAAHCSSSKDYGPVTDAKVGILERSAPADSTKRYKISRIIKHPQYKSPFKYNDIALLETDREIALDHQTVPACLYTGHPVNDTSALVTGWGTKVFRTDKVSNVLQKVTLQKFSDEECSVFYGPGTPGTRLMKKGYNSTTQICFGDWHKAKDSCNGDSGGPVQVKHPNIYCMYSVLGITSWGRECGHPGQPAIYTRILAYVPWIESVVWPDTV
ncbi:trypsin-1-like [Battus philenor]|uniref:trypsin-1-like n=1 Tax=Battus philenor TaxID=42288 RepID=UPI0035D09897